MDTLKKFWPYAFKERTEGGQLAIAIIIYLVASIIAGAVIGLATMLVAWIPVVGALVGWLLGVVGSLVGLYCFAGLIFAILSFCKVLK
ncbi:MAG: hypothetical protein IKC26_09850 [Clostridia bacterium]|nr:hypothetical protein [Clostridia bacterium]MBR2908324.1 hypothetical protein [Clostridia bacterium]